jgi:hypothetical protein
LLIVRAELLDSLLVSPLSLQLGRHWTRSSDVDESVPSRFACCTQHESTVKLS